MKIRSKLFWLFVVLTITYAAINLIAAPPRTTLSHYHIASSTLRIINISVIGPIILIWFIGLYAFQKLYKYTSYVRSDKQNKPFLYLCRGVQFTMLWLPCYSSISSLLNLTTQHDPGLKTTAITIASYVSLIIPLVGFIYLSKGARGLSEQVRQRPSWITRNVINFIVILIGISYTYLVARAHNTVGTSYHLPILIVLFTIVAPYIFSWYLGLLAAYELHLYTFKIKGILFKRGWNQVAFGIAWIIVFSIVLQFVLAAAAKFANLPLVSLLCLIYGDIVVLGVGYVFIALGAHKLTKIEEV